MLKKIGFLTLGQGLNTLVNIMFLPFMSRALSYEDYGTYGQTLLIVTTLVTFLSFGLPQMINVFFSKNEDNFKKVLSNNVILGFFLGLFGIFLSFFFLDEILLIFKNDQIKKPFTILIWSIVFSIPYNSFNSYLIYQGRIKASLAVSIFPNLIKISGVITVVFYYKNVESIAIVLLFVSLIQFVWCVILGLEHLTLKVQHKEMKEQLYQGIPLGVTSMIAMIMLYMDSLMVSNILGVKEYAIFRNGAFEIPFLGTLYASVAAIILPEVAKLWQQDRKLEIAQLKGKVILNTSLLVYPILGVLIFYSQQLIQWYFGSAYAASAIIFSIYNFTLIIRVNNYSDVLIAAHQSRKILIANLVVLLINFVLNYFLIQQWQAVGAAISTVISLFILVLILLYFNHRLLGNTILIYLNARKTFAVLFISLFSGYIFCYLIPTYVLLEHHLIFQIISVIVGLILQYILYWYFKIIDTEIVLLFKQKLNIR